MCTLEKRGNIFFLTLTGDDEQHRLSPTLISTIRTALSQIYAEAKPGSALITTADGKFFSNGFDLSYAQAAGPTNFYDRLLEMVEAFRPVVSDLISLPLPTIAAVTGHAAAAGFMLALSHDYVLMRKDKGVLYMSEIDLGMNFPDYFMALMKSKISSPLARRDVVLQGLKIKADKAVELGIIDSAYDSMEETMEAGLRLGEKLGGRKWKGEIYADIRKNCFPEISQLLGLVENYKSVVPARL